jgi:predicted RNase H-like nuclease (RuvC/YqgF family)
MQNEMIALILKDLPNQTAGVLKNYLAEADTNAKAVAALTDKLANLERSYKTKEDERYALANQLSSAQAKIASQDALTARELALEKRERNLELELVKGTNSSLQRENAAIMDLARTVFKNPTRVTQETKSIPVALQGGGSGGQYYGGIVQQATETKQTTETVD